MRKVFKAVKVENDSFRPCYVYVKKSMTKKRNNEDTYRVKNRENLSDNQEVKG